MKEFLLGGQAIIEGVLMKSSKYYAMAIRKNNGKIITQNKKYISLKDRYKFLNIPILRGFISLIEMMIIGIKALDYSANQQSDDENENTSNIELIISLIIAIGLSIFLFVYLPLILSKFIMMSEDKGVVFNIIDGIIRIMIFLLYITIISVMGDVRNLFKYHGAEHKVVNAFEAKEKLTVKNVKKYSRLHPRCGTSFVFIVLIISIIFFSVFDQDSMILKFAARIFLIPLIIGVSYEILRISAKYQKNLFFKMFILPGLMFQKFTAYEPDDKQIEVSIRSIKEILKLEKNADI